MAASSYEPNPPRKKGHCILTDIFAEAQRKITSGFVSELIPGGEWKSDTDYWCLSPLRTDKHIGSFHVFIEKNIWMYKDFAVGDSGDVIGLASKVWGCDLKEAAARIAGSDAVEIPKPKRRRGRPSASSLVALDMDKAKTVYTKSRAIAIAKLMKINPGENIVASWWYKNASGQIEGLDVRFEKQEKDDRTQKYVFTYWYDGSHLRASSAPVLVYARDLIQARPNDKIVIHEGAKCASMAQEKIPSFVHTAWSGGSHKAGMADWSCLKGRDVIIYPDADEPGLNAATTVRKAVLEHASSCVIRQPYARAVEQFGEGADIAECLQVALAEEVGQYLADGPIQEPLKDEDEDDPPPPAGPRDTDDLPFKILGVADDGLAYFLDQWGRLQRWRMEQLNSDRLLLLASTKWWKAFHPGRRGVNWRNAIDEVRQLTGPIDFDPESVRGRGAWKEPDGRICYHDGEQTIGEWDESRLYIRRTKKDIGLSEAPAAPEVRKEMLEAAAELSFETKADCIRCLAWSVLAPFCGALSWRPTGLITGKSNSGKTTALNFIIRPLSMAETCSGTDSSAAGIRQHNRADAIGIIVEEAEVRNDKQRVNRDEQFAYARQCTSDDAPQAWKGTVDGQGSNFGSEKMFLFAAINPIVQDTADQNRIFQISMVNPGDDPRTWKKKEERCKKAFTKKNCRAVRSYTWLHLKDIIRYAAALTQIVHRESGYPTRYSYLEAILFAAYWIVFEGRTPSEKEASEFLAERYDEHAPEQVKDDAEVMVDRILDEIVPVDGNSRERVTIAKLAVILQDKMSDDSALLTENELRKYKRTADLAGIYVLPSTSEIAFYKGYDFLARLFDKQRDYHKMLARHPMFSREGNVHPAVSHTRAAVIFKAELIQKDEIPFD